MNEVDAHLQWAAYSVSPAGLGCELGNPTQVRPANLLERQLCTEAPGKQSGQTITHATEGEVNRGRTMYGPNRPGFLIGDARGHLHIGNGRLRGRGDQELNRPTADILSAFIPPGFHGSAEKKALCWTSALSEGREQAIQLAAGADVLVESFCPGDMADWGLANDTLSQLYPRLVYCSITGFGNMVHSAG